MTTVTLHQYRPSEPLELSASTVSALVANYANRVEVRPAPGGGFVLRGTKYVGLIRVDDLDLVIQAKIPTLSVFWMLGFADRLVRFDPSDFPFEVEPGLLDVLARLFARQSELVIRRGLYREYIERDENLRFVRGRILPLDDLRTNQGLHHQVVCRYADLTADVPHNQILRTVTDQLLRFQFRLSGIRERLAWNSAHLAEVTATALQERDFSGIRYGRLNAHYRAVHALARLIVRHFTFEFEPGTQLAPSFIVDMNLAYQDFLTRLVEEQARFRGLRLRSAVGLHLDEDRRVKVEPDIVLTDGRGIRAAIDAKYKCEDPEADVYQALAYAKALGLARVALVYPADGEVVPTTHRIRNDVTTVLIRTVPVGHGGQGFVELEKRAGRAVRGVLDELLQVSAASNAA